MDSTTGSPFTAARQLQSIAESIGPWQRAAYKEFDLNSEAYENMIAFHPFVRRVFFDTL